MDWDDEELSTQIYDKPESTGGGGGPVIMNAGPTMPDPVQNRPVSSPGAIPRPPKSTPPTAGPPQPGDRPRLPAPSPSLPGPGTGPGMGAPSPFDIPDSGPPRPRADPTAVTTRGGKGRSALGAVLGAFVVLLVAAVGAGVWFFVLDKDPGTIQLTTTPPDPVVRFDEEPVPATSSPFVIPNVEPGTMHLLEVRKAGFRPWSMQVEVQPGQTLVLPPVTLESESGEAPEEEEVVAAATVEGTGFTLETDPSGAKVFVDGRELEERTPVEVTDLSAGTHSIRVENGARYARWETQIQVNDDQVIALPRVTLDLASVTVSFSSDPEGATVTLVRGSQRRNVGRTPTSADVDLTGDGAWTVEMALAGHEPFSRELEPEAGEAELEFEATLTRRAVAVAPHRPRNPHPTGPVERPEMNEPDMSAGSGGGEGTLRVNTRPWSQVFVDGRLIGNTPQMNISLPSGSHRLTLVNSDFNIRETVNVQIRAGQVTTKIVTLTPGG